jgi:hypothetical protein
MVCGAFFVIYERIKTMTDETTNTVETTEEQKAEPETKLEQPEPEQVATPASETPVEEWDKERAAATIKAQRAEEKRLKAIEKDYERLKAEEQKRLDAQMTESERLQKERDQLAQETAKLKADILRRDVIAETGLPPQLADRLKGETKDELIADAQELLKLMPKPKANQSVTNPGGASPNETEQQKRERLFGGNQGNVFDIKSIEAGGGGVVWHDKKQ